MKDEIIRSVLPGVTVNVTKLFESIPDRIVLSVSSRDLDLRYGPSCLCGWAIRESLAEAARKDASDVGVDFFRVVDGCVDQFGGHHYEWESVYFGVTDRRKRTIERAWVDRLQQAVDRA